VTGWLNAWLFAFAITCTVEVVVTRVLARRAWRIGIVFAAQLATHPAVCFAVIHGPGSELLRLGVVELWACLVEAAIYARWLGLPRREAFALSAAANAGSLLAGAAIYAALP
jgi:hypothetical protein